MLEKNKFEEYLKLIGKLGSVKDAAKHLGVNYNSLRGFLSRVRNDHKPKVSGSIKGRTFTEMGLPEHGKIKRYILTSAQNNTPLHPSYKNLIAYCEYLNNLRNSSCEFIVGTITYNVAAYKSNSVKNGKAKDQKHVWFADEIIPFIKDHSVLLAPSLAWCGELTIDPTTVNIFASMERYNGRKSNIIPHARLEMKSCPSMADENVKFNYSTGTITQRNYIQKNRGIKAEEHHNYGGVLVEVDHGGSWWVRQLYIADDESICDLGHDGCNGVIIRDGKVELQEVLDYVYCGDVHVDEMDLNHKYDMWGEGKFIDTFKPKVQYMGDVFSMARKGHHSINDFHNQYSKKAMAEDSVEDEVKKTAEFLNYAHRPDSKVKIVGANHDRHLDIWLNTADYKKDMVNAKYFLKLQYQVLDAKDRQDDNFNILEYALKDKGIPNDIEFMDQDVSTVEHGVLNNLHGDLGVNGSRGSTMAYVKLSHKVNKGHDHTAAIVMGVFSAGACAVRMPYMRGLHTHSLSHILGYKNGERAIVTFWKGKPRA